MRVSEAVADLSIGAIGGYVGTKLMEPVSMRLYALESETDRQREDAARPGPPFEIAAKKTLGLLSIQPNAQQLKYAGLAFHYGLGMSWGPVYLALRRLIRWPAPVSGLAAGAAMSLLVDEGVTPLLGFSAPNRAYPLATHLRGVVAHLVFGVGVAMTVEIIRWLGQQTSQRSAR